MKKGKCLFLVSSVEFLGHKIDSAGLHPLSDKLESIEAAPTPSTVTELKAYLGLLTYYGKFLSNLSTRLAHLYQLLKKVERRFVALSAPVIPFASKKCPSLSTYWSHSSRSELNSSIFPRSSAMSDPILRRQLICSISDPDLGFVAIAANANVQFNNSFIHSPTRIYDWTD